MDVSQTPDKQADSKVDDKPERDALGRLLPGNTANPAGRPKGKTLKEYAREFLVSMSDEEKNAFLNSLAKDMVWRMAEGNPHQSADTDLNVIFPKPIDDVPQDSGLQENTIPPQKDSGNPGGNGGLEDGIDNNLVDSPRPE